MDAIDLRDIVADIMPGVHSITYKSRLSGNNQSSFNVFTLRHARKKKIDLDLQLVFDADLSTIMTIWSIPQESMDSATVVSGTGPLSRLKDNDLLVDGDTVWQVKKVLEFKMLDQAWNCACQQISPSI